MKRAFTLIELLVVIAIIAILAAILFPVFAQAKAAAKKTASLSNVKQMSLGVVQYNADNEDNMPCTLYQSGYTYGPGRVADFNFATDAARDLAASYWSSSIQPYIKSWDLYKDAGMKGFNPYTYSERITKFTYSLNGYLNLLSASSTASPAVVPSFWMGMGNQTFYGYATSWPYIRVKSTGARPANNEYRFQRSGDDCTRYWAVNFGGAFGTTYTWDYRAYGNTSNMSYVDGHAKAVNVGSPTFPFILNRTTGGVDSFWVNTADSAAGCDYYSVLAPTRETN